MKNTRTFFEKPSPGTVKIRLRWDRCPRCGNKGDSGIWTENKEHFVNCPRCGYQIYNGETFRERTYFINQFSVEHDI